MLALKNNISAEICKPAAAPATPCAVQFEAAVENQLSADESIWAFSYGVPGKGVKSQKETRQVKDTLKLLNSYALDLTAEKISAITYYREKNGKWRPITAEEFHPLALNPKSKLVARFAPDFLLSAASLRYMAPAVWQNEGLSPSSTSTLTLSGKLNREDTAAFEIVNLDDQPIKGLTLSACRRQGANKAETACNASAVALKSGESFTLALDVKAARNIKSDQPAFKVLMRLKTSETPALQLAIPFKPQPNYFLFAVTGFLVGGLIAVMMLFMRRKQRAQAA